MMANGDRRREALRGADEDIFDVLAEVLTPEEWGELLRAPLVHAAGQGNRDIAQKLMGAGAEIGYALHAAARRGHEDMVNDLLENGASVAAKDNNGCTPLHVAAREGTSEMVQLLLLKGADEDALDNSELAPLFHAIFCDKVGAARALLAAGAGVNLRCSIMKESVLHAAARHGNIGVMRAVMERGGNVDAVDSMKRTPLHLAAVHDKVEAIDALVEAGANIGARDDGGCTHLHYLAAESNLEALLALLNHAAHVNAQNTQQLTPLHWAIGMAGKQEAAEVVDSLLRAGADETSLNEDGDAPAEWVGRFVAEGDQVGEEVDRVRQLLATAPADRASVTHPI